jgi:methylisocitrate lyase
MMKAAEALLQEIKLAGTQKGFLDRMQTRAELYKLIDYAGYQNFDAAISASFEENG